MSSERYDVVVIGAGFAGLYMLHRAREQGLRAVALEAADELGGVWNFNRYPGARCDVESIDYSYSFSPALEQQWSWPERYSTQPSILAYLNHVADRFELRSQIQLGTRVRALRFDEAASDWELDVGDSREPLRARHVVLATGALSAPRLPDYEGIEDFAGEWYHTAAWPHQPVSFAGKRVAVIGTGSSGTQVSPMIAREASHLYVFQRTPNFTVPAPNAPLSAEYEREIKASYRERRRLSRETASGLYPDISRTSALAVDDAERERIYEENWQDAGFRFIQCFSDLLLSEEANATVVDFLHRKIAEQVHDPRVAALLQPKDHFFGTKRPCVASDFYPMFNRDNVSLVDLRAAPIERVTPSGLTTSATSYELDAIVFATGFDAMTGAISAIEIVGRGGSVLAEKWANGPRSYLGLAVAGFPNLFVITGPGSPSVLTNVVASIEQQVEWLADLFEHARAHGVESIEAEQAAEDAWVAHVNEMADATLYPRAQSWYLGANVPHKARVFMPYPAGLRRYRRRCAAVAEQGYEGFVLTSEISTAAHR